MYLRIDKLQFDLPLPKERNPNAAATVQELFGGRFGEISTLMNYTMQSFNFRGKKELKPYYDLISNIATEELGHIELVAATINALLAGPVWESPPYLVFAHHLVARAGTFARQYNAALADYRRQKKVRTPTRPMPDLAVFDESAELPFWLDDLSSGGRTRPTAFARDGGFVLAAPHGDEFTFDPAADGWDAADRLSRWLRGRQLRLSPRARLRAPELGHEVVKDTLNVLLKYEADIEATMPQVSTFIAKASRQNVFG